MSTNDSNFSVNFQQKNSQMDLKKKVKILVHKKSVHRITNRASSNCCRELWNIAKSPTIIIKIPMPTMNRLRPILPTLVIRAVVISPCYVKFFSQAIKKVAFNDFIEFFLRGCSFFIP